MVRFLGQQSSRIFLLQIFFFFGEYLKLKVFINNTRTLIELKVNIRTEISAIPYHVLQKFAK